MERGRWGGGGWREGDGEGGGVREGGREGGGWIPWTQTHYRHSQNDNGITGWDVPRAETKKPGLNLSTDLKDSWPGVSMIKRPGILISILENYK